MGGNEKAVNSTVKVKVDVKKYDTPNIMCMI